MFMMEGCQYVYAKQPFLRIHGISNGRLSRVLKNGGGTPKQDEHGRLFPGNKTSDLKIEAVKECINSFRQYSSHYSHRDNPNRRYLSCDLSIAKLYCLYKDECKGVDTIIKVGDLGNNGAQSVQKIFTLLYT